MISLLVMVLLGISTNALATIRTILTAKKAKKPVYVLTFIDALLFGTLLSKISANGVISLVVAYAVGRVLGYFIGDVIEDKMAIGNSEMEVSLNNFDKMVEIADNLRDVGYSVETFSVYGYKGRKRYKIIVTSPRRNIQDVLNVMKKSGYEDPTFKVKEVQKIEGKFALLTNITERE